MFSHHHCSTGVLPLQEASSGAVEACEMIGPFASTVVIDRGAAIHPQLGDALRDAAGETSPGH